MTLFSRFLLALALVASFSMPLLPVLADEVGGGDNPGPGEVDGGTNPGRTGGLVNPLDNVNSLPEFIGKILDAVVVIGTMVLTLMLVYTGFLFVVAQGNEEKIRNARSALMWTVIGGIILIGAKSIGLVIEATARGL